jgi:hypothetical protein
MNPVAGGGIFSSFSTQELPAASHQTGPQFGNPDPQLHMARNLQMFHGSDSTERGKESSSPSNPQFSSAFHVGDMASHFLPTGSDTRPPYFVHVQFLFLLFKCVLFGVRRCKGRIV